MTRVQGRLKVVDTNTEWQGGTVALSSFGFGGTNAHILMHGVTPKKAAEAVSAYVMAPLISRTHEGAVALKDSVLPRLNEQGVISHLVALADVSPIRLPYRGMSIRTLTHGLPL